MNVCKNNANKHLSKPHCTPLHVSSSLSVIHANSIKQPLICQTLYRLNSRCWGLNRYEVNILQLAYAQNSYLKVWFPDLGTYINYLGYAIPTESESQW